MHTTYYADDDILEIKFSSKPIVREISQDWNICVSYDADGKPVSSPTTTTTSI